MADLVVTSPEADDHWSRTAKSLPAVASISCSPAWAWRGEPGHPKPDISTPPAFKKTLLPPSRFGISRDRRHLSVDRVAELGIADQVKAKAVITPLGVRVGPLIASGKVEIGVQQITELLATPGIDLVGPLPQRAANQNQLCNRAPAHRQEPKAGPAFVKFLSSDARCRSEEDGPGALVVNIFVKKFLRIQKFHRPLTARCGQKRFDLEIFRDHGGGEDALARHAPLFEGDDAAGIRAAKWSDRATKRSQGPPDAA